MATAHLVHGYLGAGKSTFARLLAARERAIRLSVDEWYLDLFADGPTYHVDFERMRRLLDVLNGHWPELLARGVDVVLDFGFWRRALRDEVRALARAQGAHARLYRLDCPDEMAVSRCLARNGTPGAFLISEEGFQEIKRHFEPLGSDEPCEPVDATLPWR